MSEINDTEEMSEGTFPIYLKLIQQYQQSESSLMAEDKYGTYRKGYSCGGSNVDIKLITCKDKLVIP